MKRRTLLLCVGVLANAAAYERARAAVPLQPTFSFQGQLIDPDGTPVTASVMMQFTLWDAATGGNQIAATTPSLIGIDHGLFTATVDFGSVPGANEFNGDARWLQHLNDRSGALVPVGPRIPILATPYALQTRGLYVNDQLNVGIGTKSPQSLLHVSAIGQDNNGVAAPFRIVSGNGAQNLLMDGNEIDATADGLFLNNNTNQNVVLATGGGKVGIGTANPQQKLDVNGTARVKILEVMGADLAEKFPMSEVVEPGMVVAIDPFQPGKLCVSQGAYNRRVAGVVSGGNGLSVGAVLGHLPGNEDAPPIALSGRVWVQCDATQNAIEPGDLLTTSDTRGHAMKVTEFDRAHGAILGKAMTALESGTGPVLRVCPTHS